MERAIAAWAAADAKPGDPNRKAPSAGGSVGGYNAIYFDRGTAPTRVNGELRTSIIVDPPNGRFPPLTERGQERRAKLFPFEKENTGKAWWLGQEVGPYDDPESLSIADRCIFSLEGTIPVLPKFYNNVKTIVQTDDYVAILIEWMHYTRIIRLGTGGVRPEHAPPELRSRAGDSIGWWEGDTLVVDTTNFLEEDWQAATLYGEPSPPADQHVVERFTRIDRDTLLYQFTVDERRPRVALHRRVHLAGHRRQALRVRLPRRELLDGQHAARSAIPRARSRRAARVASRGRAARRSAAADLARFLEALEPDLVVGVAPIEHARAGPTEARPRTASLPAIEPRQVVERVEPVELGGGRDRVDDRDARLVVAARGVETPERFVACAAVEEPDRRFDALLAVLLAEDLRARRRSTRRRARGRRSGSRPRPC